MTEENIGVAWKSKQIDDKDYNSFIVRLNVKDFRVWNVSIYTGWIFFPLFTILLQIRFSSLHRYKINKMNKADE